MDVAVFSKICLVMDIYPLKWSIIACLNRFAVRLSSEDCISTEETASFPVTWIDEKSAGETPGNSFLSEASRIVGTISQSLSLLSNRNSKARRTFCSGFSLFLRLIDTLTQADERCCSPISLITVRLRTSSTKFCQNEFSRNFLSARGWMVSGSSEKR